MYSKPQASANTQNLIQVKEEKVYKACIYLRLSKEDGDKEESNSISNQRQLLIDFIEKQPNIELVSERVDDGYSGCNSLTSLMIPRTVTFIGYKAFNGYTPPTFI